MIQEEIQQRIKTITDLQSIVKTMKMLSSVSVGQYEKALNSLTQYGKTLQEAFQGLFAQIVGEFPYKGVKIGITVL